MSISNYLELELLDHVLRGAGGVYSAPSAVYVSLHTGDPGETGASECTGGSYARQAGTFTAANSGATANGAQLQFTGMPSATVTHLGLWDTDAAGNFLWGGQLTAPKTVNEGDTFQIGIGDLDVTLD